MKVPDITCSGTTAISRANSAQPRSLFYGSPRQGNPRQDLKRPCRTPWNAGTSKSRGESEAAELVRPYLVTPQWADKIERTDIGKSARVLRAGPPPWAAHKVNAASNLQDWPRFRAPAVAQQLSRAPAYWLEFRNFGVVGRGLPGGACRKGGGSGDTPMIGGCVH